MITIKKYPNRRMYNTHTSTYINLAGIQSLIEAGEDVQILDSKSNVDVTTQTLLLHSFDAETLELLVPSMKMQVLMRLSMVERQQAIRQESGVTELDSETQNEEVTQPVIQPNVEGILDVEMATPTDTVDGDSVECVSESSEDSDSEITIVRVKAPPTVSQSSEQSVESLLDATSSQETVDEGSVVQESNVQRPLDTQSSDRVVDGIPSFWGEAQALNEWERSSEAFSEDESSSHSASEDSSNLSSQADNPEWSVHSQQSEDSQQVFSMDEALESHGEVGNGVKELKGIKDIKKEMIGDDERLSVDTPIAIPVLDSKGVDSESNEDEAHVSITATATENLVEPNGEPNVRAHQLASVDSDSVHQSDKDRVDSSALSNTDSSNTVSTTPSTAVSKKSTEETKTAMDGMDEMDERAAQMKARLEQMKARLRR